ncbi:MAG: Inhibitor of apoptosis-promoting Bax1 [Microgenomates bacterium OLB22]|nr:MAG: Inhibitor of apoptosis-promoting Bax1 [Microgenomates bacterium OLB22]
MFGAIIIYDLNRAMRIPYTHDNAIDVALGIYLDWVNVFIRLLRLFGILKPDD